MLKKCREKVAWRVKWITPKKPQCHLGMIHLGEGWLKAQVWPRRRAHLWDYYLIRCKTDIAPTDVEINSKTHLCEVSKSSRQWEIDRKAIHPPECSPQNVQLHFFSPQQRCRLTLFLLIYLIKGLNQIWSCAIDMISECFHQLWFQMKGVSCVFSWHQVTWSGARGDENKAPLAAAGSVAHCPPNTPHSSD